MRILVTGAGGFIGGELARLLLAEGHDVHGTRRRAPLPEGVRPWDCELRERRSWEAVFDAVRPERVYHLACMVDPSRDPARYPLHLEDLAVADRVARSCLAGGARLVHVGTCEEYGDGPVPFREDQALAPVSAYSATKAAASQWVLALARTAGLRATVARPFLTYGPGQAAPRLVPAAIRAALEGRPFPMSEGSQTRELNHVSDVARGIALCAGGAVEGQAVNVGGGEEHPVHEVVRRIFELAGADPELVQRGALPTRAGELQRFVGDHERARERLGFAPRTSLEAGLRTTIAACRDSSSKR